MCLPINGRRAIWHAWLMVYGLNLCSAFLTSGHSKRLQYHITFTHTFTHRRRCQPCKVTASSLGLAQGHLDTQLGWAWDQTSNRPVISLSLPPAPHASTHIGKPIHTINEEWFSQRRIEVSGSPASDSMVPGLKDPRFLFNRGPEVLSMWTGSLPQSMPACNDETMAISKLIGRKGKGAPCLSECVAESWRASWNESVFLCSTQHVAALCLGSAGWIKGWCHYI
jgi:hypothetical protein